MEIIYHIMTAEGMPNRKNSLMLGKTSLENKILVFSHDGVNFT